MARIKLHFCKELVKSLTFKEIAVVLNFTVFVLFTMIGYAHLVLNLDFNMQGFLKWGLITFVYGTLSGLSIHFVFKQETIAQKVDEAKKSARCKVVCEVANGKGK